MRRFNCSIDIKQTPNRSINERKRGQNGEESEAFPKRYYRGPFSIENASSFIMLHHGEIVCAAAKTQKKIKGIPIKGISLGETNTKYNVE